MGRTQRVDDKNGLIYLVTFSPAFMVIKMSQIAHFLYFLLMTTKKPVTVWAKYLSASEKSHLAILENAMYCWVLSYH